MKVELFIPCFIDKMYPDTGFNVIKLLERCGVEVSYNPEQTCCGQPSFNSGYWDASRDMGEKFIRDFPNDRYIVSPSASCTGFVKNYYPDLFEENDPLRQEVYRLQNRLVELTDFLVNVVKRTDFDASFPHKVCYHDACIALREYGIKEEPRQLLARVKGLELIEMEVTDTCCGFGGTFMAKFKDISAAMTEQKVEMALKTGAEYIVSTEASCNLNIESYILRNNLPIKPIHIADILTSGW